MAQFTYMLGAGASFGNIPTVAEIEKKLRDFISLHENAHVLSDTIDQDGEIFNLADGQREMVSELKEVAEAVKEHLSVDTLAKKYYLSNQKGKLQTLKNLLNQFLMFHQLVNGVNKRYDGFFATILTGGLNKAIELPKNINILSWNYDRQVEFSVGQFLPTILNSKSAFNLHVAEEFLNLQPTDSEGLFDPKRFSLIKLNGTIGSVISSTGNYGSLKFNVLRTKSLYADKNKMAGLIRGIVLNYMKTKSAYDATEPFISYAWEDNPVVRRTREIAQAAVKDTEYLIVIGYSFPTFNRRMDKEIIDAMDRLKKIYIQNTKEAIGGVAARLKAISGAPLTLIDDVGEFFIPFEFDFPPQSPTLNVWSA